MEVDLRAELVGGEYVWRWNTTVTGVDGESGWRCRQSTLLGVPLSAASLGRLASTHVPTLGETARELLTRFPGWFSRFEAALHYVGDLSVRYKI